MNEKTIELFKSIACIQLEYQIDISYRLILIVYLIPIGITGKYI